MKWTIFEAEEFVSYSQQSSELHRKKKKKTQKYLVKKTWKSLNPPIHMLHEKHSFGNAKYCLQRMEKMQYWKNCVGFTYFIYIFKYY